MPVSVFIFCISLFSFFHRHYRAIVISHHNAKFTNNGNGDALPSFEGKRSKETESETVSSDCGGSRAASLAEAAA
jgi:hypothetical protein